MIEHPDTLAPNAGAPSAGAPSVGAPMERVDGPLKVRGAATYASEMPVRNAAHAVMITSTIPAGRITRMDTSAASRAPGVLAVITHENAMKLPGAPKPTGAAAEQSGSRNSSEQSNQQQGGSGGSGSGQSGTRKQPPQRIPTLLQDDRVFYNGQPIGIVVADTFEHAMAAVPLVHTTYSATHAELDMATGPKAPGESVHPTGEEPRFSTRGDIEAGLRDAAVRVDHTYTTPFETHNPMETHNTVAVWEGDKLTLYDSTQGVFSVRGTVARTFSLPQENVRVVSPFTGGGFGSKGGPWSHVMLCAMAAKHVGRPVKLVLTRRQMFGPVGGRPRTVQRITLGAKQDGQLTAIRHISTSNSSMIEDWLEPSAMQTRMLYASPNAVTDHEIVRLNVGSPTFMRAPGESSGTYALESAMDELAVALKMDPVALRLRNYAERDPQSGRPWSSKSLRQCYQIASERFGWSKRNPEPRSMRDGRLLVGWGMATATYPARTAPSSTSVSVLPDGRAWVRSGTQEIGCGTYTVMSQIAADALGVPPDQVRFELGDTDMPPAPVSAGSLTAASAGTSVYKAAVAARTKLIRMAITDPQSPLHGAAEQDVNVADGRMSLASAKSRGETYAALIARNGGTPVEVRVDSTPGAEQQEYSMHSFGAVFTEVHVDPDVGEIRVPRVTTAHAIGRVLNAKTLQSQIIGGVVWGIGMGLLEQTLIDPHMGRYMNSDLAEYQVPINADIGTIDVTLIDEKDSYVNPIGVKGGGEIGITGVAASLANAIYHATGKRVRDLPITLDKILV
jgi:xanthine dehydrogenase YagR molybdenum-binding subunit